MTRPKKYMSQVASVAQPEEIAPPEDAPQVDEAVIGDVEVYELKSADLQKVAQIILSLDKVGARVECVEIGGQAGREIAKQLKIYASSRTIQAAAHKVLVDFAVHDAAIVPHYMLPQ
jgi:hypothetical protein